MGYSYYFYVETKHLGQWTVPLGFEKNKYNYERLGNFAWISSRSKVKDIFFGAKAVFPFRRELPPERRFSALFQYLGTFYDYQDDEYKISWLPYTELLVDLWDEMQIIVTNKIYAKNVDIFGDGNQPFPKDELLKFGWEPYQISNFRQGTITELSIDCSYGKYKHDISLVPPDRLVNVTWVDSVTNYLGDEQKQAFLDVRKFGSDEELRVISMYS